MQKRTKIHFEGKEFSANLHLSLQEDGCYIFTIIEDPELIFRFGTDIDLETDCVDVIEGKETSTELQRLKQAILEAAKALPEFHTLKPRRIVLSSERAN